MIHRVATVANTEVQQPGHRLELGIQVEDAGEEQAWHIQVSGLGGYGGQPQEGLVKEMGGKFSLEAGEPCMPAGRIR